MERNELYQRLTAMPEAQLREVAFRYGLPEKYIQRNAAKTDIAIDLIQFAEAKGELAQLAELINSPDAETPPRHQEFGGSAVNAQSQVQNQTVTVNISGVALAEEPPGSNVKVEPRHQAWRIFALKLTFLLALFLFSLYVNDTVSELFVYAFDNTFGDSRLHQDIAIISFDEDSEAILGQFGRNWRKHHADLINTLVKAGVKVIVFDLYFTAPSPYDAEFMAAIDAANAAGVPVVLGADRFEHGEPVTLAEFQRHTPYWGSLCVPAALGYIAEFPLAYQDRDLFTFYSLAHVAYAAYRGQAPHTFPAYRSQAEDNKCGIVQGYNRLAKLSALTKLEKRTFAYHKVAEQGSDFFRGSIVLVGNGKNDGNIDKHTVKLAPFVQQSRLGIYLHADYLNSLLVQPPQLRLIWYYHAGMAMLMLLVGFFSRSYAWGGVYVLGVGLLYGYAAILLSLVYGMTAWVAGMVLRTSK